MKAGLRTGIHDAPTHRMKFESPLLRGQLVRRYKRFLADVRLADGTLVTAHCANPGSMLSCMVDGGTVWLSRSSNPSRKLAYTWEISEVGGVRVFVNPLRSNDIVADAIRRGRVAELGGYSSIARERKASATSRLDLELRRANERCWVEVKSATLSLGSGRTAFPDSVTTRGTRHLGELARLRRGGDRAVLLFAVNRSDAQSVEPADDIDPVYGRALRRAAAAGVEVLAYRTRITLAGVSLAARIPVVL